MKRLIALISVTAAVSIALGQTAKPDPARVASIWNSATNRMGEQADVWYDEGDYPRSTQMLKFMASSDPSDYEINNNLGWMLENMERWDEALATYVRYRKTNPSAADAAYPEANFYFMQRAYSKVPPLIEPSLGKKPEALRYYEQALAICREVGDRGGEGTTLNNYRILGHAYERLGLLADAERVWKQMIEDHPNDPASKNNLVKVERKLAQQKGGGSGKP